MQSKLTLKEAAEEIGISPDAVMGLVKAGALTIADHKCHDFGTFYTVSLTFESEDVALLKEAAIRSLFRLCDRMPDESAVKWITDMRAKIVEERTEALLHKMLRGEPLTTGV